MGTKKETLNYKKQTAPGDQSTAPPYPKKIPVTDIEKDVDYTRSHMDRVIDELADRLNPRQFVTEVLDIITGTPQSPEARRATGATRDAAAAIGERIRHDPLPFALIGAGLAWLAVSSGPNKHTDRPYVHERGGIDESLEHDSDYLSLREQLEQQQRGELNADEFAEKKAAEKSTHAASSAKDAVRNQQSRSRESIAGAVRDNPLAASAVALGAGALMGFLMPHSSTEDRYLHGPARKSREATVDRAHEMAESVRRTAQAGGAAAGEEARRQGVAPEQLAEQARTRSEGRQASAEGDSAVEKAERIVKSGTRAAREQAEKQRREDDSSI
ncbi:MAG: DUF3618 domain-containing protein [Chitinivibrionales bacterium]